MALLTAPRVCWAELDAGPLPDDDTSIALMPTPTLPLPPPWVAPPPVSPPLIASSRPRMASWQHQGEKIDLQRFKCYSNTTCWAIRTPMSPYNHDTAALSDHFLTKRHCLHCEGPHPSPHETTLPLEFPGSNIPPQRLQSRISILMTRYRQRNTRTH